MRRAVRSFFRSTGLFVRGLLSTGLLAAGSLLLAACDGGGSPSAPSPVVRPPVIIIPPPRVLEPGPAMLLIIGPSITTGALGPCTPPATGPQEASVMTRVILSRDGEDWVARMQPPLAGDLELRFRDGADGRSVSGSVRGFAAAEPNAFLGGDLRVHFAAADGTPATLVASRTHDQSPILGLVRGEVRFVHASGTPSTTCPGATLSLGPALIPPR